MRGMLLYEGRPQVDRWLIWLFVGLSLLTFILGIYLVFVDVLGAVTMFGITAFDAILFRVIIPQSLQIYTDRLVIKFPGPFSKTIRLSEIKEVRPIAGGGMVYSGIKFTTSVRNGVEILRYRGMPVVISPADTDTFIEQLNRAAGISSIPIRSKS